LKERAEKIASVHGIRMSFKGCVGIADVSYEIIDRLRKKDVDSGRAFLKEFYGTARTLEETEPYFPHGDELGANIAESLFKEYMPWFRPANRHEAEGLEDVARKLTDSLGLEPVDSVMVSPDFAFALRMSQEEELGNAVRSAVMAAYEGVSSVADSSSVRFIGYAMERIGQSVIRPAAYVSSKLNKATPIRVERKAMNVALLNADYIAGSDSSELRERFPENPGDALMYIHKLGLWPAGIANIEGHRNIVIWHPKPFFEKGWLDHIGDATRSVKYILKK